MSASTSDFIRDDNIRFLKKDLGHTIGAVSRYDQEYLKYYFPGIKVEVFSSYPRCIG